MLKIVLATALGACLAIALAGCSQSTQDVSDAVAAYGFTNVETTGHDFWACSSKEDTFSTKFTATNAAGQHVSGVVCSGFLKGSTVRNLRVIR